MNTIYDTLNDRQKEAVLHTDGPLLILAEPDQERPEF